MTSLETKNYHIPQFAEEDATSWGDYNAAMEIIDSTMKNNSELGQQGINDAAAAMNTANAAATKANMASAKADTANANAMSAATLANQANQTATAARGAAEAAEQKAQEALDASGGGESAAQEALEKAENAMTAAQQADGNASRALQAAADADTKAQEALSQATQAGSSATNALQRAENALSTAQSAQNTANTALEKAEEALAGGGETPTDPELERRVKVLETDMGNVKNQASSNAGDITAVTERVETLEENVTNANNEIAALNRNVGSVVTEFSEIKSEIEDTKNGMLVNTEKITAVEEEIQTLSTDVESANNRLNRMYNFRVQYGYFSAITASRYPNSNNTTHTAITATIEESAKVLPVYSFNSGSYQYGYFHGYIEIYAIQGVAVSTYGFSLTLTYTGVQDIISIPLAGTCTLLNGMNGNTYSGFYKKNASSSYVFVEVLPGFNIGAYDPNTKFTIFF